MSNKILSERINQELDTIGVPQLMTERVQACSKLFELPRFKAHALLSGMTHFENDAIEKVAGILEVKAEWLMGADNNKHIN